MEEELTAKMHSEFTVSEEDEKLLRSGCVWQLLGYDAPREKIEHWAKRYGVTYDICMEYRSYWKNLHDNTR